YQTISALLFLLQALENGFHSTESTPAQQCRRGFKPGRVLALLERELNDAFHRCRRHQVLERAAAAFRVPGRIAHQTLVQGGTYCPHRLIVFIKSNRLPQGGNAVSDLIMQEWAQV